MHQCPQAPEHHRPNLDSAPSGYAMQGPRAATMAFCWIQQRASPRMSMMEIASIKIRITLRGHLNTQHPVGMPSHRQS